MRIERDPVTGNWIVEGVPGIEESLLRALERIKEIEAERDEARDQVRKLTAQ